MKQIKRGSSFKQIDSTLPCVCSVTVDRRKGQKVVSTALVRLAAPRVLRFCSHHSLTLLVIYYGTNALHMEIACKKRS